MFIIHLQRSSLSEVVYSGELLLGVNGTSRPSTEYHHHEHNIRQLKIHCHHHHSLSDQNYEACFYYKIMLLVQISFLAVDTTSHCCSNDYPAPLVPVSSSDEVGISPCMMNSSRSIRVAMPNIRRFIIVASLPRSVISTN